MPKINVLQKLTYIDGKPMYVTDYVDGKPTQTTEVMTLRKASVDALLSMGEGERPSGEEMLKLKSLAEKIYSAKDGIVDLTSSEIVKLLGRLEKFATTWAYGLLHEMLEGKNK